MKYFGLIPIILLIAITCCTTQPITTSVVKAGEEIVEVTFSVSGLGSDISPHTPILIVDAVNYSLKDLPVSFTWVVGSTHVYEWIPIIPSITAGKRYVWESASGLWFGRSGLIAAPISGGFISASYKTQYMWVFSAEGLDFDAVGTVIVIDGLSYRPSELPVSFWWDVDSEHTFTYVEFVNSAIEDKRYASHNPQSARVAVTEPKNITQIYHIEYILGIGAEAGKGTTNPPPGLYWVDYESHITIKAIPNPSYVFKQWAATTTTRSIYDELANPTTVFIRGSTYLLATFAKAFDFTILVNPSSIHVYKGSSATVSVHIEYTGEQPRSVALTLINAPQGVIWRFEEETVIPPLLTTLIIEVSPAAEKGTYVVTIMGLSDNVTKTIDFSITILEEPWYEQVWPFLATLVIVPLAILTLLFLKRRKARIVY
ncbi:MAG: hypothetical protein N3E36_01220 [Sulfolobales archaeon]|nr:hypothetical protein [Sulfolobales archaeon]